MKLENLNDKAKNALLQLETSGLLEGNFRITEHLLTEYDKAYGESKEIKPNDRKALRKITLLNLLEYKRSVNKISTKEIKEGFIYIVSNPAWPGLYKIGKSISPKNRVANMQTYSPFRDYVIESYYYSAEAYKTEQQLHSELKEHHVQGEWFSADLNTLRTFLQRKAYNVPFV